MPPRATTPIANAASWSRRATARIAEEEWSCRSRHSHGRRAAWNTAGAPAKAGAGQRGEELAGPGGAREPASGLGCDERAGPLRPTYLCDEAEPAQFDREVVRAR